MAFGDPQLVGVVCHALVLHHGEATLPVVQRRGVWAPRPAGASARATTGNPAEAFGKTRHLLISPSPT
jgi:hypothetical protein